jgi:aminomethyltransferase
VEGAGATPYGADVIEPIRVEVGMIVTDYDYEPHQRTPFDLGLDRFVSFNELNMGTEKLRAVAAEPPNRFVTVRLDGDVLPEYGSAIVDDGEAVGVLTSPAVSPRFGPIGLAVLRTDRAVPGTRIAIEHDGATITGTVDVLAIYDPAKEKPRV